MPTTTKAKPKFKVAQEDGNLHITASGLPKDAAIRLVVDVPDAFDRPEHDYTTTPEGTLHVIMGSPGKGEYRFRLVDVKANEVIGDTTHAQKG